MTGLPGEHVPEDELEIKPLDYDHDEGGIVHGLVPPRDAPRVIELGENRRRYRVEEPHGEGAFADLDAMTCSCAFPGGVCFHLRAAAIYDELRGSETTE